MFSKLSRVSPAMGVALVALVFSVSGTSLAQGAAARFGRLISGSQIKRGSLPGDRIKSNSVTGKQIAEKSLSTVPSALNAQNAQVAARATNAQRATNADNALSLGGTAAAGYLTFASHAIPSGTTVTGAFGISSTVTETVNPITSNDVTEVVQLPDPASADLTDGSVNFAPATGALDADASCVGNASAPTAPAGKVCLYLTSLSGTGTTVEGLAIPGLAGSRSGFVVHALNATAGGAGVYGTWAYTAP